GASGRSRGRIKQATIDPPEECHPVKSHLLILAEGLRLEEFQVRKHGMLMGEIRSPINKIRTYARGARNRVLGKSFVFTQRLSKKPRFFVGSASRTENIGCFFIWGDLESFRID
ncbi:MAG: hypothetical protein WCF82_19185, partial [Microcoleus sp.]